MKIRKAVITAAARSQRDLPLQTLVDRDGVRKSVLAILLAEMNAAGAEEVCVVVRPGDEEPYAEAAGAEHRGRVRFVAQAEPRGYGHALLCAAAFVAGEPFLHQVGDHVFLSADPDARAAALVCGLAAEKGCAVSGVQSTRESQLPLFGTVGGTRVRATTDLYVVDSVMEKPTPTEAEQKLIVPGLRAGHYLCFIGVHALPPLVMELLARADADLPHDAPRQLSPVLDALSRREQYLAVEVPGRRYPLDTRYGLLNAQLALALAGPDRDEVLAGLCDLLAQREMIQAER